MAVFLNWDDWSLHYRRYTYRLCENTYDFCSIGFGPIWIEWDEWE